MLFLKFAQNFFYSVWQTCSFLVLICVLALLSWLRIISMPLIGSIALVGIAVIFCLISGVANLLKRRWLKGTAGLLVPLFLIPAFAYAALALKLDSRMRDLLDTSTCSANHKWDSTKVVSEYGKYSDRDSGLELSVCVVADGLLDFNLKRGIDTVIQSGIYEKGRDIQKDAAGLASSISVFHRWGILWRDDILWIYSGDVGCFSWRKGKDGKYHCQLEECERPRDGKAQTILGQIYLDIR